MLIRYALCLAALVFIAVLPKSHADAPLQTVRIGVSGLSGGKLPIFVASDKGYFAKRGIKVDTIEFSSGGAVVQAFVGGSIDLCICAGDHVVDLHDKGLDATIVSGLDEHNADTLVTKATSPYQGIKSLKGQKLAITSPGSYTDNTLRWALKRAGLDPDHDVQIVSTGTGSAMLAAIRSGQVAAGVLTTDQIIKGNQSPDKLRVVEEWRDIPYTSLTAIGRKKWVDAHADLARAFAQGVADGARSIQTDDAEAEHGVALIFPHESPAFVKALTVAAKRTLTKDGSVSAEGFRNTIGVMRLVDPSLQPVDLSLVDAQPSLVK